MLGNFETALLPVSYFSQQLKIIMSIHVEVLIKEPGLMEQSIIYFLVCLSTNTFFFFFFG